MSRNNTIIYAGFFSAFTLTASSATFHFLNDNFASPKTSDIINEVQSAGQISKTESDTQAVTGYKPGQSVLSDQNIYLIKANVPDAGAQAELPRIQHPVSIRGSELDPHSDYLNSLATSGFFKVPERGALIPAQDGQKPLSQKITPDIKDAPKNTRALSSQEVTGSLQGNNRPKKKSPELTGAKRKKENSAQSGAGTTEQDSSSEPLSSLKNFNFVPE